MSVPRQAAYVVVGAGMHGLSTAYHLASELRERGAGSGSGVGVLEKSHPGAGASGIACGVVRNNYFQPAMSELMQACVEVWESDPAAYHYNAVGYIALGAQVQESDLAATYERQQRIGYRSELIEGEADVDAHMKGLFPDWRAQGVTVCLHEHQGGFAFNLESVNGLRDKCLAEGVSVLEGVEVTGFASGEDRSVSAVETSAGEIEVGEQVVVAPGPWAASLWAMLGMPDTIDIATPSGDVVRDRPMWTYWNLQEGEIVVDPQMFATADGGAPPVIHLDTDAPLYTDDGELVTDEPQDRIARCAGQCQRDQIERLHDRNVGESRRPVAAPFVRIPGRPMVPSYRSEGAGPGATLHRPCVSPSSYTRSPWSSGSPSSGTSPTPRIPIPSITWTSRGTSPRATASTST